MHTHNKQNMFLPYSRFNYITFIHFQFALLEKSSNTQSNDRHPNCGRPYFLSKLFDKLIMV